MVRTSALRKNSYREIRQSFGRFFAILAIVALGVGFFAGLKVTKSAMIATGDSYFRDNALFDFRLISTLGLYDEDLEEISKKPFVTKAEGAYSTDAIIDTKYASSVAKIHSLSDSINKVILMDGRLPEKPGEILIDSNWFSADDIGSKVSLSDGNKQETLDMFNSTEFTIVGTCKAVSYINFERGNTTLGSGKISGFVYMLPEDFVCDYYTEIFAVTDASGYEIYTKKYNDEIDAEKEEFEELLTRLANDRYTDLKTEADEEIADAEEKLADARAEIADNEQKIADAEKEIADGESKLSDGYDQLNAAESEFESMKAYMPPSMYEEKKAELDSAREELEKNKQEIVDAKADIEDAKQKIEEAKAEVSEHQIELDDAKDKLADLEKPDTYVLTRGTNIGYACYENDSSIVEGIANVFPVFFFLVAALVCMTTMNRMVEEQRTQIGIMKALGYSEAAIMGKYLFYSGSAAIIGCVLGFSVGCVIFPAVIWEAYKIMYTIKEIVFVFSPVLAAVSVAVSLLCSVGATYVTLRNELRSQAADLIRPKAPKNGKRVLLERIGFIWNRINFTGKVSVRNVFRYKKRFFMMVLGVGGCYGLLITGFGIKDSIADVCDCQFEKIQNYDMTVTFKDEMSPEDFAEFEESAAIDSEFIYARLKSVDVESGNKVKSATLVVFSEEDGKSGADFINFMDSKERPLTLPSEDEAILSLKLAKMLGVKVGDEVVLRDPDLKEIKVKVSAIMLNYVYNWAYITPKTYEKQMREDATINTAYVRTSADEYETAARLSALSHVSAVSVSDELSRRIDNMMESLNQIVVLVTFSAAALAFIVMYNLTNINITERLREIATLKVLGFYSKETNIYVFRENFILTAIGCAAGLFMGYALHRYVMYNITVEVVSFDTKILPMSYVWGIILTFLFALFVDVFLSGKLERIRMAESLKSVE